MMRQIFTFTGIIILFISACTFTRKVRTGMQAYEVKQYSVAAQLFAEEYETSNSKSDRAIIAFYAGESYSSMNDPRSASTWYFKANESGYGQEALESYANALKQQEKYAEAMHVFEDLLKASPGNAGYRSNINLCRQAYEWSNSINEAYEIAPVPFNSSGADYSPVPTGPGQLLFTSDWDGSDDNETYLWTGRAFSNIYEVNTITGEISRFDDVINSDKNEGTGVLSPDGGMMVFTRCYVEDDYDAWCKLMYSYLRGGIWSTPEPFWFVEEGINYGHPAFTANGTTLIFSSDDPTGLGGHDLFVSQFDETVGWSEPSNLGSMINTSGNEQYPTVYYDTLYFSSDKLAGLGGLDIFKSYLGTDGNWVSPINMRAPINSGGDDFGFAVDTFSILEEGTSMQGYFTSSRDGASGNDDIYSFAVKGKKENINVAEVPEEVPEEEMIDYQLFLVIKVMEPQFKVKGDPNSGRVGKRALPNGPIIISDGLTDQRFVTDELGQFLIRLEWGEAYTFTAKYRDHLVNKYTLNTATIEKNKEKPQITINKIMELDPIFKNKEIVIDSIFYDFDQWAIREDARPPLDHLSSILKNNPHINIQLSSYTDCRGTDEYNLDLSQKRAEAAIEYLKSTGIPGIRMVALGFGESNLVEKCDCDNCTEEEHQANRLTTFKIVD